MRTLLSLGVLTLTLAARVGVAEESIPFTADSSLVQFICAHSDPAKPDPRTGRFGKLTGEAKVDAGQLKSVQVDIDTKSLTTDIEKLTNHLKSPDFFDVNEHPKATFKSTSITPASDGKVKITGDLTLHGVTKSISFPATVTLDKGLKLEARFDLDRTQFGMTYGAGKVENKVAMTVRVGK